MSESKNYSEIIRSYITLRNGLIFAFRACLVIAGISLAYLLFIFGHYDVRLVETYGQKDVTPKYTILIVAAIAGTCALIAAMLQWIGLPAEDKQNQKKKTAK